MRKKHASPKGVRRLPLIERDRDPVPMSYRCAHCGGTTFEPIRPKGSIQQCRDCGEHFPYDREADTCPACVAKALGESWEKRRG